MRPGVEVVPAECHIKATAAALSARTHIPSGTDHRAHPLQAAPSCRSAIRCSGSRPCALALLTQCPMSRGAESLAQLLPEPLWRLASGRLARPVCSGAVAEMATIQPGAPMNPHTLYRGHPALAAPTPRPTLQASNSASRTNLFLPAATRLAPFNTPPSIASPPLLNVEWICSTDLSSLDLSSLIGCGCQWPATHRSGKHQRCSRQAQLPRVAPSRRHSGDARAVCSALDPQSHGTTAVSPAPHLADTSRLAPSDRRPAVGQQFANMLLQVLAAGFQPFE